MNKLFTRKYSKYTLISKGILSCLNSMFRKSTIVFKLRCRNRHTRASKLLSNRMFVDLISLWIIRGWPDEQKTKTFTRILRKNKKSRKNYMTRITRYFAITINSSFQDQSKITLLKLFVTNVVTNIRISTN